MPLISLTHVKLKPVDSRRPTKREPDIVTILLSVLVPPTPILPAESSSAV